MMKALGRKFYIYKTNIHDETDRGQFIFPFVIFDDLCISVYISLKYPEKSLNEFY